MQLNTRQWDLYKYLKSQDDWRKLEDVQRELGYKSYRLLKRDIRTIRENETVPRTVLTSTAKGVKLATKEEYAAYTKRRWSAIVRMIKLQSTQDKKAGLDGQYRLVFGKEKEVMEAFR